MPQAKHDHKALSPSTVHQRLVRESKQRLAFDGGDVKAWQAKLRRKVKELIGLDRILKQPRPDLDVRSLWRREHEFGSIEKIIFTSEPGADVPAYVCLPRDVQPPYDWFICLQGHSTGMHNSIAVDLDTNEKAIDVAGDRDFALGCMKRGVAAIAIEQRCFGERAEREQPQKCGYNTCLDAAMHALMLGRTMIGERVYDVDRTIDYLATRDDVDGKRIGVMGNSGGGTISLFSAATLPRLAWGMPSCYFCTFAASVMSIYHCPDNFVPGLLDWAEMPDIMGLFAPKPVVVVNGKEDEIFPIKASRAAFKRLREIYKAAGAEQRCQMVVGPEGHRFYADLAWPKMLKLMRS